MMKHFNKISRLFFILILSFFAHPAYAADSIKTNSPYQGHITIGITVWPGYMPLLVANDKGYFKEKGLDVELKQYPGLTEISEDYVAGKLQARGNLTLDAIKESLGGLDHRVVLAIDYSNGADAIMARSGIDKVQDFRGKRVAYEQLSLEEFFLTWALEENEMRLSDIIPVPADPETAAKLLKEGKVDVAVSFEPFISQNLNSKDFHPVYSSKDAPGLITDILTFRADFIKTNPEAVEAIMKAYFKALVFWKEHPKEAHEIVAKELKDTAEGISNQLQSIKMLDERDNQVAFTFAPGLRSLYGNMRQIGKFVLKTQMKKTDSIDTDKLVERKFIKKIAEEKNS